LTHRVHCWKSTVFRLIRKKKDLAIKACLFKKELVTDGSCRDFAESLDKEPHDHHSHSHHM
ncbi:MAG: hypothetical protein AAF203_11155, partial [Pseudomonadota bacterium]